MNNNAPYAADTDSRPEAPEAAAGEMPDAGMLVLAVPATERDGAGPPRWELRFRALVEMLPVQFWTVRADGSIECQSGEWRRYAGLSDLEEDTWSWQDVIHPDDLGVFLNRWQDIQRAGTAGIAKARFKRGDGRYRCFETSFVPERNDGGLIARWYATNTDVQETELLRARGPATRHPTAGHRGESRDPPDSYPDAEFAPARKARAGGNAAQLARGQLEALTHTVEALAMESSPERLVEHVLRTITAQLIAHSSSVWMRDKATDRMGFECALEGDKVIGKNHSTVSGLNPWIPKEDRWPWPNVFRTGRPEFVEDIRVLPHFDLKERLVRMGIVSVLMVPMSIAATIEGAVAIRFSGKRKLLPEEIELAQALANQAMLALQISRLHAQSRETAVIAERNRMARDIHDTIAQGLTGVIIQLEASTDARWQGMADDADGHIRRAIELARTSLQEARRSVRALRPASLVQRQWERALSNMLATMTEGTPLRAHLSISGEQRALPVGWDENLLRIGQEALTNTLRHAQASTFRAHVVFLDEQLVFDIQDDGGGFDTRARSEGYGLVGIRERVEQMSGALELTSMQGKGTNMRVTLLLRGSALAFREDQL